MPRRASLPRMSVAAGGRYLTEAAPLNGRLEEHNLDQPGPGLIATWLATDEARGLDAYSLNALVASGRFKLNKTALEAKAAAATVSVAELQKIQAAEKEAEKQQKIEAIAASVSQRKAEKEAAKTVKRQAGNFSEPKAKRQDCDVSKPKISSPTAPTPIPSSVPSTEPKPAAVCQSRCGVRTFLLDSTADFSGCLVGCELGGRECSPGRAEADA